MRYNEEPTEDDYEAEAERRAHRLSLRPKYSFLEPIDEDEEEDEGGEDE